jgi:primary-amine oxidase
MLVRRFLSWCLALACAASANAALAGTAAAAHPLDPLTPDEIFATVTTLRAAGHADKTTRYPFLRLLEPSKTRVLAWDPGEPIERRSFTVLYHRGKVFEAVVDVALRRVTSFREIPGVQAPILNDEIFSAGDIALSSPEFVRALERRGYRAPFANLEFLPLTAGYFGDPLEEGRRMMRVTCLDATDVSNPWAHPIENLHADIDLKLRKVIRVVDTGIVPTPRVDADFPVESGRPPSKPLIVTQPQGAGFTVEGHSVRWDRWSFHFRVEEREGLLLSLVRHKDGARQRSVLYQAALSETFVPYGDPTSNWYYRTYMDEGEYGIGEDTPPLERGVDCPDNAQFFNAVIADDDGGALELPNAVCLFERTPHLLWRHYDVFTGETQARAGRELVLRYTCTVGNYDYFIDWVFKQDGSLQLNVGAGGVMEFKGVNSTDL